MVIGIGGSSNSGKSKLAKRLVSYYGNDKAIHLCQDDYVYPTNELKKINGHTDWEYEKTIDIQKFIADVELANSKYEKVFSEGIFAFHFNGLNKLYSKKVYLKIDRETFIKRKQNDLRWGKEPMWYIEHIWESHIKNTKFKDLSNVVFVDATIDANIEDVISFIEE
jgi:uridine kinase